jgi:NAD(P)-dependent dehydrogenase (short-subunit alcohol dehydrogenase family)
LTNGAAVLDGQVALVTGCGRPRGLGRGIALALARAGADVAVNDLFPSVGLSDLARAIGEIGARSVEIIGDVGDADACENIIGGVASALGGVDILVNNAGAPHGEDRQPFWQVPLPAYEGVLRVNTTGVFLMSAAYVRQQLPRGRSGRIINIASVAGRIGAPNRAAYCASKFAALGLTQVMALELADKDITVNAICPGPMATDRHESTRRNIEAGVDPVGASALTTPVGRIGTAEDVGRVAVFLADPAANFITGQSLGVDGGLAPR